MGVSSPVELLVYQKAYDLAMNIYDISKKWPQEEKYALTDQIRRSSRSVCANLREAWAKRWYPAHFVSKLTDCDGENGETSTWLDFARDCGYMDLDMHTTLFELNREVGRMLGDMIERPGRFLRKRKSDQ